MTEAAYHPVAGCGSLTGDLAAAYHQRWLVADAQGNWLEPRTTPRLADITVSFRYGYLVLRAPGMLRMDVPIDVLEDDDSVAAMVQVGSTTVPVVDEGDLMAAWLSNYLQVPCRLFKRHPPEAPVDWPVTAG